MDNKAKTLIFYFPLLSPMKKVLDMLGLILIIVGCLGLVNLAFNFIPNTLDLTSYIIILAIGLILAGYTSISKKIIEVFKAVKK